MSIDASLRLRQKEPSALWFITNHDQRILSVAEEIDSNKAGRDCVIPRAHGFQGCFNNGTNLLVTVLPLGQYSTLLVLLFNVNISLSFRSWED